jgi:hypothetical protein
MIRERRRREINCWSKKMSWNQVLPKEKRRRTFNKSNNYKSTKQK